MKQPVPSVYSQQRTGHAAIAGILALLLFVSIAAPGAAPARAQEQAPNPAAGGAQNVDPFAGPIRAADTIRVVVAGTGGDALGGEFRVETDDTITMPRLGSIKVGGLMQPQAARTIGSRIEQAKLLKEAHVAVYIIGRRARRVTINGAVEKQGEQPLREETRLSEVLGVAGAQPGADLTRVVITRGDREITVNYQDFVTGRDRGDKVNPKLEDADKIYVYAGQVGGGSVRVFGEVNKPGLMAFPVGTTAGQVIQQAGGITDRADRSGIVLVRGEERIPLPYDDIVKGVPGRDVALKDNDRIEIPRLERRREFAVTGAVLKPGSFPLETKVTLLEAVALAGGPQEGARENEVELRRRVGGQLSTMKYNIRDDRAASTEIADGDVIMVPYPRRRQKMDPIGVVSALGTLFFLLNQIRR